MARHRILIKLYIYRLAVHAEARVAIEQVSSSLYAAILKYGASKYVWYVSESRINS